MIMKVRSDDMVGMNILKQWDDGWTTERMNGKCTGRVFVFYLIN